MTIIKDKGPCPDVQCCHRTEKRRAVREVHMLDNLIGRFIEINSSESAIDGITGNNFHIIGFLAHNRDREICQRDIEKEFCITRSTASRVLSLMEQKGLVRRKRVEGDARLKQIVLTDRALRFSEDMKKRFEKTDSVLTAGFSDEETEELFSLIDKMKENIINSVKEEAGRRKNKAEAKEKRPEKLKL